MRHCITILVLAFIILSCAHQRVLVEEQTKKSERSYSPLSFGKLFSSDNFNFLRKKKSGSKIGLVENKEVKKWISFFTKKDSAMFVRYMLRGATYRKMIEKMLVRNKMPKELYYLALVESGFMYNAKSSAGAIGIWQLMAGTARRYGMRVDKYVDQRYDPVKSTKAALQYLKDLHNVYQSWPLAIAAYNSGERRVLNAIMRSKNRDFWAIASKKRLPRETVDYVPKFMAAVIIGSDMNRFSIDKKLIDKEMEKRFSNKYLKLVNKKRNYLSKRVLSRKGHGVIIKRELKKPKNIHMVTRGEKLAEIAKNFKISLERIKKLNNLRSNNLYVGQIIKVP